MGLQASRLKRYGDKVRSMAEKLWGLSKGAADRMWRRRKKQAGTGTEK